MSHVVVFPSPAERARSELVNAFGAGLAAYGGTSTLGQFFTAAATATLQEQKWQIGAAMLGATGGYFIYRHFAPLVTGALQNRQSRRAGPHAVLEFRES